MKAILMNKTVVPVEDILEWAQWFETSKDRFCFSTEVGNKKVSTVFLGISMNQFFGGNPDWFETAIINGEDIEVLDRHETYEQAEKYHNETVIRLRKELS